MKPNPNPPPGDTDAALRAAFVALRAADAARAPALASRTAPAAPAPAPWALLALQTAAVAAVLGLAGGLTTGPRPAGPEALTALALTWPDATGSLADAYAPAGAWSDWAAPSDALLDAATWDFAALAEADLSTPNG